MVYVVTTSVYPAIIAEEAGKKYIEVMKKYPIDKSIEKALVPVAVKQTLEGMYVISITTVKQGKIKEVLDIESKRMLELCKIEGYKYSIEIMYDAVEAMGLLGMEAPI